MCLLDNNSHLNHFSGFYWEFKYNLMYQQMSHCLSVYHNHEVLMKRKYKRKSTSSISNQIKPPLCRNTRKSLGTTQYSQYSGHLSQSVIINYKRVNICWILMACVYVSVVETLFTKSVLRCFVLFLFPILGHFMVHSYTHLHK